MIVHLIDGTYELFRCFYGARRFHKTAPPFGAVTGVLATVVQMLEQGGGTRELKALLAQSFDLDSEDIKILHWARLH